MPIRDKLSSRDRLDVDHVREPANFLIQQGILRDWTEIYIADVHFHPVLNVFFQVKSGIWIAPSSGEVCMHPVVRNFSRNGWVGSSKGKELNAN